MQEEVILLLGSNSGRRIRRLQGGIAALAGGMEVGRVSRIYAGEPSGRANQPWYLNVAVRGETALA
ncbi:MAG: 2-amino-4-hydroxy-6-hydroxymethyldihydropteridine pyrophosphokinase, partial [Deltaproteobacteria bacterium]